MGENLWDHPFSCLFLCVLAANRINVCIQLYVNFFFNDYISYTNIEDNLGVISYMVDKVSLRLQIYILVYFTYIYT